MAEEKENNLEGLERYEKNMENESSSTVTYGGLYGRRPVLRMRRGMHRRLLAARIMLAQRKDSRQQRTRRQEITDRLLLRHRERSRGTARFRMEW